MRGYKVSNRSSNKSKKTAKRGHAKALSGVPGALARMTPQSWSDADKALWCRFVMAARNNKQMPEISKRHPRYAELGGLYRRAKYQHPGSLSAQVNMRLD